MEIKVPARFYQDHTDRSNTPELLVDAVIKDSGSYLFVELNDDQIANLLSDAEYYADGVDYPELRGLQKSAKATVKAINTQVKCVA